MTNYVKLENEPVNVKAKVNVDQGSFDDPIRIKSVGMRRWVIAGCALFITLALEGIYSQLKTHNDLYRDDLDIKKEQLDLARRQFALDSIAMEQNRKIR